jgi:hypothetical protein
MTAQHTPGPWLTQQHCAIVPLPANTYTRIYAHRPGQEDITIGYKVLGRSEEDEANARLCNDPTKLDHFRTFLTSPGLGHAAVAAIGSRTPLGLGIPRPNGYASADRRRPESGQGAGRRHESRCSHGV